MTAEDRTARIASLKRQLFFHQNRRKMVQTDVELSAEERAEQREYHDRLVMRLLGRVKDQVNRTDHVTP